MKGNLKESRSPSPPGFTRSRPCLYQLCLWAKSFIVFYYDLAGFDLLGKLITLINDILREFVAQRFFDNRESVKADAAVLQCRYLVVPPSKGSIYCRLDNQVAGIIKPLNHGSKNMSRLIGILV